MPPKSASRVVRWVVANPNHIPKGVKLISWQGRDWFEGDEFVPPAGLKVERLVREGYIVERS